MPDRIFEVERLSLTYSGHLAHTEAPVLTDVSLTVAGGQTLTPMMRHRVALVMQMPVLFEGSVRENLLVRALDDPGDFSESRLGRALAEVGLDLALLDRDAHAPRAGDRQRVAIARTLLRDPQALVPDEPIPARAAAGALLAIATTSELRRTPGLSIVAVTHRPALVRRVGGSLLYVVLRRVQRFESAAAARGLNCVEGVTL